MKVNSAIQLLFLGCGTVAMAQSRGTYTPTGNLTTPRHGQTSTLLHSGKVLIAGGSLFGLARAELYDPSTGSFTATGNMLTASWHHTATLLPDGKVLIAGGFVGGGNAVTNRAELYDPSTGTFSPAGDVTRAEGQAWHAAALLGNGKVLIAGMGVSARLYDPATGIFMDTGPYAEPSPGLVQTANVLPDGSVIITGCTAGCSSGVAQLYDTDTNTFRATGPMRGWYNVNTATSLMNGKVLIAGSNEYADPADAEVYDPSTGVFTNIGNMAAPHGFGTAVLLPDGTVFIAGGSGLASTELYDPSSGKFSSGPDMMTQRSVHTATLLSDGKVLIAGGPLTSSAELYHPAVLVAAPLLFSLSGDGKGQGAIWHGATGQVVASGNPAIAGEVLSMYTTGLNEGSLLAPYVAIGGRLAEVQFFGNAPGYPGFNQVNVRVPDGIAAGSAVPVRLSYLGRPSNEVTIAVQ